MSVGADLLVQIAPPEYAGAAPLVPLIGAAFLAHSLLIAVYRSSRFPEKRKTYVSLAVASVGLFVISAMALIPRLGGEGAALAVIAAFVPGAAWITFRSQLGPSPIEVSSRRLIAIAGISLLCVVAVRLSDGLTGPAHTAAHAAILVAFPVLVLVTGAVPRRELAGLRRIGRAMLKRPEILAVGESLSTLETGAAVALRTAAVGGQTPAAIAAAQERTPDRVAAELTEALRTLTGEPADGDRDALIGLHLFSRTTFADRQANGRALLKAGVGAQELATLELGLEELRRLPEREWSPGVVVLADELAASCAEEEESEGMPEGLRRELRVLSRRRMKVMLRDESAHGENLRYVVSEPAADSRAIVVSFSSAREDTPPGYSYARETTRPDCTTLFLRFEGHFNLGTPGDTEIRDEVFAFLREFFDERDADPADAIATGGSLGGIRALVFGVGFGMGHMVVGAPIVRMGDFVYGDRKRESDRRLLRGIGEQIGGSEEDRARDFLNDVIPARLREPGDESPVQPPRHSTIHLFISERDQAHKYTTKVLRNHCARSDRLSLDVTWADYVGHTAHKDHFREHLPRKLGEVIESINASEPARL
jgi:hypothetical protein